MSIPYVEYDAAGRITAVGEFADEATKDLNPPEAGRFILVLDGGMGIEPTLWYVDLGGAEPTLTARPASPVTVDKTTLLADGTDAATFSDIPAGSLITIEVPPTFPREPGIPPIEPQIVWSSPTLSWNTTVPGFYQILIESFPEQDILFLIEATT